MKKFAIIALGLLLILASMVAWVISRREFIQNKILDSVVQKYSSSLPFKIESYQITKNLNFLRVNLNWNGHTITLAGDLKVDWRGKDEGWKVHYVPEITVDETASVHLVAELDASTDFSSVKTLEVKSDDQQEDRAFVLKGMGIDLQKPRVNMNYLPSTESLKLEFNAASGLWTDPKQNQHAISAALIHLTFEKLQNELKAQFRAKSSEVLWDSFYSDLALEDLPIRISTQDQKKFEIEVGEKNEIKASFDRPEKEGQPFEFSWKSKPFSVAPLAKWAIKTVPSNLWSGENWSDLEFKHGTLSSRGSASFDLKKQKLKLHEGFLEGSDISFRSLAHSIAAKQISFSVPYRSSDFLHHGWVEALQIYFKKLPMKLKRTDLSWSEKGFQTRTEVPLVANEIPIQIGQIKADFNEEGYDLKTSLKLGPMSLGAVSKTFCLPAEKTPPATLQMDFPKIEVSPGEVHPQGRAWIDLFKGKVELSDIGLYDLSTDVPEIDFNVEWKNIDLQSMGDWSKFGEIKGTLEGYSRNVVFQSFLPTQYDFLIQVKHLDQTKAKGYVEFSPEAMKNFVKIFTGQDLDEQIPGIAGWVMFGWPSHVFGGYDVQYAGIYLHSSEGLITVETLDPPEVVKETQKHFILNGPRFKMPIRSPEYPLVIDATAMSNFVHQMLTRFEALKGDSNSNENNQNQCLPPEL